MSETELRKIVGSDYVFDDPEILKDYSIDRSFVIPIRPKCMIKPKDSKEVQDLVKWANKTLTTLIPVSSGPPHFLGSTIPSVGGAVVVDFSRMKKIVRVDPINRIALIEPGVTFSELDSALKEKGLSAYMPLSPRSSKSVVGSMLEREPMTMPNQHWDCLDPLLCLEVVYGTGDKMKTGDASGPDTIEEQWEIGSVQHVPFKTSQFNPVRLITGSQGTIGLVTWTSLKCRLLSEKSRVVIVPSDTVDPLIDLNYQIVKARIGDHCFILNGVNLACLVGKNAEEIEELKGILPPWALVVSFEAHGQLPEEKMAYEEADFMDMVSRSRSSSNALKPMETVPRVCAEAMTEILSRPSEEEYWKLKYKGECQDIFFLTTLDKTPVFIEEMGNLCLLKRHPAGDVGVYLQMIGQGTGCHCEFNLYFDPAKKADVESTKWFVTEGSAKLTKKGAFFSRPYGPWAKMAYAQASGTVDLQRRVKSIFDPNRILNSGKLCF